LRTTIFHLPARRNPPRPGTATLWHCPRDPFRMEFSTPMQRRNGCK
jgi:hypothetical protein